MYTTGLISVFLTSLIASTAARPYGDYEQDPEYTYTPAAATTSKAPCTSTKYYKPSATAYASAVPVAVVAAPVAAPVAAAPVQVSQPVAGGPITIKNNNANANANSNSVTASQSSTATTGGESNDGGVSGLVEALLGLRRRQIDIENTNKNGNQNTNTVTATNDATAIAPASEDSGDGTDDAESTEGLLGDLLATLLDGGLLDAGAIARKRQIKIDNESSNDNENTNTLTATNTAFAMAPQSSDEGDDTTANDIADDGALLDALTRRQIDIENSNSNANKQENSVTATNDATAFAPASEDSEDGTDGGDSTETLLGELLATLIDGGVVDTGAVGARKRQIDISNDNESANKNDNTLTATNDATAFIPTDDGEDSEDSVDGGLDTDAVLNALLAGLLADEDAGIVDVGAIAKRQIDISNDNESANKNDNTVTATNDATAFIPTDDGEDSEDSVDGGLDTDAVLNALLAGLLADEDAGIVDVGAVAKRQIDIANDNANKNANNNTLTATNDATAIVPSSDDSGDSEDGGDSTDELLGELLAGLLDGGLVKRYTEAPKADPYGAAPSASAPAAKPTYYYKIEPVQAYPYVPVASTSTVAAPVAVVTPVTQVVKPVTVSVASNPVAVAAAAPVAAAAAAPVAAAAAASGPIKITNDNKNANSNSNNVTATNDAKASTGGSDDGDSLADLLNILRRL